MEQRVLVAHRSTDGSTEKIAETVAEVLRTVGIMADVLPARSLTDQDPYKALGAGGALYTGRWHKDARRFVRRHRGAPAGVVPQLRPLDSTA
ncbi:flavodoxin domain-containing protein [Streptomyces sp. NPDC047880]|uniref:flavodoxin domain-containing protein n=1 Tax=Streptomyces sp. NPDC047880 TaxID=3155626 RepID=UPI0034548695